MLGAEEEVEVEAAGKEVEGGGGGAEDSSELKSMNRSSPFLSFKREKRAC